MQEYCGIERADHQEYVVIIDLAANECINLFDTSLDEERQYLGIIEAILLGQDPGGLSLQRLYRLPLSWMEQRRVLGFLAK